MSIAKTVNIGKTLVAHSTIVFGLVLLGLLSTAVLGSGRADAAINARSRHPVTMVELNRSGGFTGASDHFVVVADGPHPQTPALMRTAGGRQFRDLADTYADGNPCCDRYRYVVKVHYRNGVVKTVTAVDGTPGLPSVLREVIDMTVAIGQGGAR